ncbi:monovalent cation/H+ antiporter subunit E [Corynebacterium choanae]|uniref:Putative monovalent cation/H+ antiporter subunit E n=1 Tax=Corynebacterium choanae TaxID=1862358 RepID=A0A3G6J9B2_9CORY|nr:monovalent cation/H+ antiporter subunit E [Corynebacterium choanae]AZA14586.1 putative monovalent cation/H+ antiporter subunit E [Corynebacterium choanae]
MLHAVKYLTWLTGQVIAGAVAVAVDMCRKETNMDPIVVEYPLRITDDFLIAVFTTSITMTPGTISCGVITPDHDDEPTILLVQAVYGNDPAEVIAGLAEMEQRLSPAIADVDYGAPGQGSGDPQRSTAVVGHSDDHVGPTETDNHHIRGPHEQPHKVATDTRTSDNNLPGQSRIVTQATGDHADADTTATISAHAAAIGGYQVDRAALAGTGNHVELDDARIDSYPQDDPQPDTSGSHRSQASPPAAPAITKAAPSHAHPADQPDTNPGGVTVAQLQARAGAADTRPRRRRAAEPTDTSQPDISPAASQE